MAATLALAAWLAAGQGVWPHSFREDEFTIAVAPFQPQAVVFHAQAASVEVDTRVLDSAGKLATDLKRGDFTLADNGKPQTITSFALETRGGTAPAGGGVGRDATTCAPLSSPRTILLYFDDLATPALELSYARGKLLAYLDGLRCNGQLPAGATVGIATGSGVGDLGFTRDFEALRQALRRIGPHSRAGEAFACPLISPGQAFDIMHYGDSSDAAQRARAAAARCSGCTRDCGTFVRTRAEQVWELAQIQTRATLARLSNAVQALAARTGDRTLVVTSSGFLTVESPMRRAQQKVVDAAIRARVVVDAIQARGLSGPSLGMDAWSGSAVDDAGEIGSAEGAMQDLAASTGGAFLHNSNALDAAYRSSVSGPDAYYALGFTPGDLVPDGSYHRLKVRVAARGSFRVAARAGYFAPDPSPPTAGTAVHAELARLVMGHERLADIDAELRAVPAPGGVHLDLRLNPGTIMLASEGGRHVGSLVLVFALMTRDGRFMSGREMDVAFRLTGKSLKLVSRPGAGIPIGVDLAAPPGDYDLRAVIYQTKNGARTTLDGRLAVGPAR